MDFATIAGVLVLWLLAGWSFAIGVASGIALSVYVGSQVFRWLERRGLLG